MIKIRQWSAGIKSENTMTGSFARTAALFLSSVVSCILAGIFTLVCSNLIPNWYGIIAALVLILLIIPFYLLGKKHGSKFYKTGILTNSAAWGFLIGAYYSYFKTEIAIDSVLIASAGFLILSLSACLLILCVISRRASTAVIGISLALIIAALIYLWIINGTPVISFSFFLSLWLSFYCVTGMVTIESERNIWRDIFLGSCGAFFLITLLVLLIISEGEGFDGFGGGGGKKKKP